MWGWIGGIVFSLSVIAYSFWKAYKVDDDDDLKMHEAAMLTRLGLIILLLFMGGMFFEIKKDFLFTQSASLLLADSIGISIVAFAVTFVFVFFISVIVKVMK